MPSNPRWMRNISGSFWAEEQNTSVRARRHVVIHRPFCPTIMADVEAQSGGITFGKSWVRNDVMVVHRPFTPRPKEFKPSPWYLNGLIFTRGKVLLNQFHILELYPTVFNLQSKISHLKWWYGGLFSEGKEEFMKFKAGETLWSLQGQIEVSSQWLFGIRGFPNH